MGGSYILITCRVDLSVMNSSPIKEIVIALPSRFRRSISALLAVWMTVIGLGVSVTHAHAAGSPRHVHGRGLSLISCPVEPLSGSNESGERHRHLFLLGFEFPNESTPDAVPTDSCVTEPVIGQTCDSPIPEVFDPFVLDFPAPGFYLIVSPVCSAQAVQPRLDPPVTLSVFARRLLSGVLRS